MGEVAVGGEVHTDRAGGGVCVVVGGVDAHARLNLAQILELGVRTEVTGSGRHRTRPCLVAAASWLRGVCFGVACAFGVPLPSPWCADASLGGGGGCSVFSALSSVSAGERTRRARAVRRNHGEYTARGQLHQGRQRHSRRDGRERTYALGFHVRAHVSLTTPSRQSAVRW